MPTLLLPCDGSAEALLAVRHVIAEVRRGSAHQVHLVNVQPPFSAYVARHVGPDARMDAHRERAEAALAGSRSLLDAADVPCQVHLEIGDKARCIASLAGRLGCERIVLATARRSGLVRFVANSLTSRILEHSTVPVEIINSNPAGALQRLGIPASVGAGLTLLWIT